MYRCLSICVLMLWFLLPSYGVYSEEPRERVFFTEGNNQLFIARPEAGVPYSFSEFLNTPSADILSLDYDPVGDRIFFVSDVGGSSYTLHYMYFFDPKSSNQKDIVTVASSSLPLKFTLDPAGEIAIFFDPTLNYLHAKHYGSTTNDVYDSVDLTGPLGGFDSFLSLTALGNGNGEVLFSMTNVIGPDPSQIWYTDGQGLSLIHI